MIELIGEDLFDQIATSDAICITTNCTVSDDGSNPMGGGCAGAANRKWKAIDYIYGDLLRSAGRVPVIMGYASKKDSNAFYAMDEFNIDELQPNGDWCAIVAYPTMHTIMQSADLTLIGRSAHLISEMADTNGWGKVVVPRPGSGIGGLDWETEVKPLMVELLDDRFVLIHKEFARPKASATWTSTLFHGKNSDDN